jgi:tRNA A-37 threonylcarbamoyl transferase component Bud32/tetratricopeptide (TPR) repeat protein
MDCLDDNAVIAYVERILPETERQRIATHLDECEACLAITCAVARSTEATAATEATTATDATEVPDAIDATVATAATVATDATAATTGRVEPRRGDAVGRYTLLEMIGRGAMGSVYVAHDPQLDRKVALKIVRSERFAQHEVRARLSREARAMAKVTHPHVVTVYDAGELDDGVFIAMELIDGDTLASWLAAEQRPWRAIAGMFVAVGRGLGAAHAAGIVHRDFKPENVLVDKHGRAAVSDFGLAVEPGPPAPARSDAGDVDNLDSLDHRPIAVAHELTRTGVLLGTPRYMSPEQFRGGVVDARTDQFSFAVALYEALYHQPPFAGTTLGELRAAVSGGALCGRPGDTAVPVDVHRVLVRALAAAPADRYPSIERLLDALEAAARPRRRRRLAFVVAGIVAAAAASAGAVMFAHDTPRPAASPAASPAAPPAEARAAVPPSPPLDTARIKVIVDRFANHSVDPRLDDTLDLVVADVLLRSTRVDPRAGVELPLAGTTADALVAQANASGRPAIGLFGSIVLVGSGDGARDGAGYVISLEARGSQRVAFAASEHAANPGEIVGATARLAAGFLTALGDPPGPIDHVLSPSLDALHAYAEGQRFAFAGQLDQAIAPYRRALAADPDFVEARQGLGVSLYDLADSPGAVAELERAKQGAGRLPDRKRLTLLGDYFGILGKYTDAIMTYEQLLARWPGDSRTEINLIATAIDAGSWEVALEQARRAAHDHPEMVVVRGNLVLAELANGRFDDAVRDGAAMLADMRQPLTASVAAIAAAQALLGRSTDARATYDRVAGLGDAELADGGRADLALYEGRLDDADALLRGHVAPAAAHGPGPSVASTLVRLARSRLRRGDRAGALRIATAAMGSGAARPEYMAAATAIEAGSDRGAEAKIRAWAQKPLPEWRLYGKLLAGDLARAANRPRDAIAAYSDAALIAPSWLTHERLGRAYLAAGAWADAERELGWCLEHRGEAAVFMTPTLSYLPDVMLAIARSKEGRHAGTAEVRAAYAAVLALAPDAQHDPITDEARQRIARLTP